MTLQDVYICGIFLVSCILKQKIHAVFPKFKLEEYGKPRKPSLKSGLNKLCPMDQILGAVYLEGVCFCSFFCYVAQIGLKILLPLLL